MPPKLTSDDILGLSDEATPQKAKVWACPYCNAINNESSKTCRSCGKPRPSTLHPTAITIVESQKPPAPSPTPFVSKPKVVGEKPGVEVPSTPFPQPPVIKPPPPKPIIQSQKIPGYQQPSFDNIPKPELMPVMPPGTGAPYGPAPGGSEMYKPNLISDSTIQEALASTAKLPELLNMLSKFDPNNIKKGIYKITRENQMMRPGFSSSWVITTPPEGAVKRYSYFVGDSEVVLYTAKDDIQTYYYISLPEYSMPPEHIRILQMVREELPNHYPKTTKLESLAETRSYVSKLGERLIFSIAQKEGVRLGNTREDEIETVKNLSKVLTKYIAGLGVIEVLLRDPNVQDVYIDAPSSQNRVHLKISPPEPSIHDKCLTNITVGDADAEALLSRFRMISGRPFSEAMPVLETDVEEYDSRITVVGRPLSPDGISMALRRHSVDPWTLLKLIYNKSITPIAAGVLSFLIDGRSTILVAGPRGAGKTSFVGALMLEFPQNQRVLTIEDTLELPVPQLQALGYKIQSLWVQSSLGGIGQMTANDALIVSLRMGESAIVLGEVRGQEAKTLYEAMRAGTAGSSVLGTIHGNSSKAIYERVVHDIGIPAQSFMATDAVVIAGLANPGGTQIQKRRVIEITEVDKEKEPGNFNTLLQYDESSDSLVATDIYLNNSQKIKAIAEMWGMTYEEAIQNIGVRASIRSYIVEYATTYNKMNILKANWVAVTNNVFWVLLEKYSSKGSVDYHALLEEWKKWFNRSVRYA